MDLPLNKCQSGRRKAIEKLSNLKKTKRYNYIWIFVYAVGACTDKCQSSLNTSDPQKTSSRGKTLN